MDSSSALADLFIHRLYLAALSQVANDALERMVRFVLVQFEGLKVVNVLS